MTAGEDFAAEGGRAIVDAFEHPMVVAALARLAGNGTWDRVLAGKPVEDPLDLADAELLVAARVLEPSGSGYAVLRKESYIRDSRALSGAMVAQLQRALQHALGGDGSWSGDDLELVLNQGRSSAAAGDLIADDLLHAMPTAAAACAGGSGRFLDVGTGVAAIAIRLCERFPGLHCVGIDVLDNVLELGRAEVARAGFADRITLRVQGIEEIDEDAAYDVAWVPQLFIPRGAMVRGLPKVFRALRPGGGVVVPTVAPPHASDEMEEAMKAHTGHVLGGGPIEVREAHALLAAAGFVDVRHHDYGHQVMMTAIRPEA